MHADHTKVGTGGYFAYGTLRDFNLWITTTGIARDLSSFYGTLVDIKEA